VEHYCIPGRLAWIIHEHPQARLGQRFPPALSDFRQLIYQFLDDAQDLSGFVNNPG
jgi:hypothetical protein